MATKYLDELWLKEALRSVPKFTDDMLAELLSNLKDNWIYTVENIAAATIENMATAGAKGLLGTLLKKKAAKELESNEEGAGVGSHLVVANVNQTIEKFWGLESLNPELNFCCKRRAALDDFYSEITSESWPYGALVLVQAPPATGKSSFIRLMASYSPNYIIVRINLGGFVVSEESMPKVARMSLSLTRRRESDQNQKNWAQLQAYILENLLLPNGNKIQVPTLEHLLDNTDNIFQDEKFGMILVVDEAQKIIGQAYADHFFDLLSKREIPTKKPFHKTSIFFSTVGLEVISDKINARKSIPSQYSSTSEDWYKKYDQELLRWSENDTREFCEDYNTYNNCGLYIVADVPGVIHAKHNGHAGLTTAAIRGMQTVFKQSRIITEESWQEYRVSHSYYNAISSIRSSTLVNNIMKEKNTPAAIVCSKLLVDKQVTLTDNDLKRAARHLIKYGIIRNKDNFYEFTSDVMAVIVLRALVEYHAPRIVVLSIPKTPLEFLTVCLPMLQARAIRDSVSTTNSFGINTAKERVWTSHIFTAARLLLPPSCIVDPEVSSDSGLIDVEVHNGVEYYIEFLITNFGESTPVQNMPIAPKAALVEHMNRFTPKGLYKAKGKFECAIVNITHHDPPPLDVGTSLKNCFATVYHFVINDYKAPYLTWHLQGRTHKMDLPFDSCPRLYNITTRSSSVHPCSSDKTMQQLI